MAEYPREKSLSLEVQRRALHAKFEHSRATVSSGRLRWEAELVPHALGSTYRVHLSYRLGSRPRVHVLDPVLVKRVDENGDLIRCDHMHSDDEPCLFYHHRKNEWHGGLLLVDTIVPWTSEWLLHYEIWVATGSWRGGGYHDSEVA